MYVLKVFNNNIVMTVNDQGEEMIVTGKGIGFQIKSGDSIDKDKIEKRFTLQNSLSKNALADLYKESEPEVIESVLVIIDKAEKELGIKPEGNLYIAVADHLNFAIERQKEGLSIQNPLIWEVKKFYPNEYEVGLFAIKQIKQIIGTTLPDSEAASIALHLVNARKEGSYMEHTIKMTKIVHDILGIVRHYFAIEFDEESISFSRFITHLQFFAQRVIEGESQGEDDAFLYDQVVHSYPEAFKCTNKIKHYLHEVHQFNMSQDEQVYLTIHIQRSIKHN